MVARPADHSGTPSSLGFTSAVGGSHLIFRSLRAQGTVAQIPDEWNAWDTVTSISELPIFFFKLHHTRMSVFHLIFRGGGKGRLEPSVSWYFGGLVSSKRQEGVFLPFPRRWH